MVGQPQSPGRGCPVCHLRGPLCRCGADDVDLSPFADEDLIRALMERFPYKLDHRGEVVIYTEVDYWVIHPEYE